MRAPILIGALLTAAIGTGFGQPIVTSITKQPTNQSTSLGASVTFSVLAAGATPLSYQWRFNGVDLPGKTTSSLVLTNLQLTNAGGYAVENRRLHD